MDSQRASQGLHASSPPLHNTIDQLARHLLSQIEAIEKLATAEDSLSTRNELSSIKKKIHILIASLESLSLQDAEKYLLIDKDDSHNDIVDVKDSRKQRVLVIEDDYEARCYIKDVLNEKYEVIESADGAEGFTKAAQLLPDLIISDVVMPGLSGIEVCRKIKTDVTTSHIPVILLTGRSATEHRIEGFEARADAYINKPFNPIELTLRIRNLLEMLYHQRKRYAHDIYQTPRQVTTNSTDEKFLHHVIKFVEDHIDDPQLDISGLAEELNMSASSLYRKIKSITGMSSIDFVINHKMKYAAHLLLAGKYAVKEIAFMVGFTDARYFSTRFKKYFQYTPTEYVEYTLRRND